MQTRHKRAPLRPLVVRARGNMTHAISAAAHIAPVHTVQETAHKNIHTQKDWGPAAAAHTTKDDKTEKKHSGRGEIIPNDTPQNPHENAQTGVAPTRLQKGRDNTTPEGVRIGRGNSVNKSRSGDMHPGWTRCLREKLVVREGWQLCMQRTERGRIELRDRHANNEFSAGE
jgi:hypothetical protein